MAWATSTRYLARMWLPDELGQPSVLGLWRARDAAECRRYWRRAPCPSWMTAETTPLTAHPNHPALGEDRVTGTADQSLPVLSECQLVFS